MTLAARQADLVTVITDLQNMVRSCDVDLNAADPDAVAIMHLREMASAAMGALGFQSGEPQ